MIMEQRGKVIGELQVRWRCELHSKDKDSVSCWKDKDICYVLANQNLNYWAIEIVSNIIISHK
jgi:hypothetical protein